MSEIMSYYMSLGIVDIRTRLYFVDMIQFVDSVYVSIMNEKVAKKNNKKK